MGEHATGTFEIEDWKEQPYHEGDGATLTRASVIKTFYGDVEGGSTAELLMAYGAKEGSAAYVGFERVSGRVHGRSGSFVLQHNAIMEGGEGDATWTVVPGSGTGELRGISGEAEISNGPDGSHSFALDYELP